MDHHPPSEKCPQISLVASTVFQQQMRQFCGGQHWRIGLRPHRPQAMQFIVHHHSAGAPSQLFEVEPSVHCGHLGDRHTSVTEAHALSFEMPASGGLPLGGGNGWRGGNHLPILAVTPGVRRNRFGVWSTLGLGRPIEADVSLDVILGLMAGAGMGVGVGTTTMAWLARSKLAAAPTNSAGLTPADPFGGVAAALTEVARSAEAQAASMSRLAVMTAESVRLASGSYVFELRDRFDAALPPTSVGVASAELSAESDLGPLELLAYHPGDHLRAEVRIAVSQAPVRRIVSAHWEHIPERCDTRAPTFASAGGVPLPDGSWELPSDVSLFVDLVLDLDVGSMELGAFETKGRVMIIITDGRPEGAVAAVAVDTRLAAIVVPDDDGVGLDVPIIEAVVGAEQRTYLLEKATGMALDLPKLRELL